MNFWIVLMLFVYILASLFLIFVILVQSGKGGGLSSLGAASQGLSDALGATGAEKTLSKMTTMSAILFMVLAILISIAGSHVARQKAKPLLGNGAPVETPLSTTNPAAPSVPAAPGAPTAPAAPAPAEAPAQSAPAVPAPAPAAPAPAK
ncbi:MAG: preprotein translocase subunit SecG [bacterium]|nr:preprotein translocase subunit SecG [bacterium]